MDTSSKQALAAAGLFGTAAIWGFTFILIKWTLASVDVYAFLFLRFAISTLLMAAIFWRHVRSIDRAALTAGSILGLLLTVAFIAQTEGLRFTTASNSALITCLYMVLVPFGMIVLSRQRPSGSSLTGIALALPGAVLLTAFSFAGVTRGDLLTAVVPVVAALHIILTDTYAKRHSLGTLVTVQFLCVALASGAVAAVRGSALTGLPPIAWFTILFNAIFASCLAFTLQIAAQRIVDPARAGIIFALEAVFGAFFGWWLGGEAMTPASFAGACLMVLGMGISESRPLTKALFEKIAG